LLLYFRIGELLSEKIAEEKWGLKIIEQIAEDLQKQLPGLRGFSYRNLMKMKQFAECYSSKSFLPSPTAQLRNVRRSTKTDELQTHILKISFTHHILILNKCKSMEERIFYIKESSNRFWSVSILEHHIESNLFSTQGKLPNNFDKTLSKEIKPSALQAFQDEYLFDFISNDADERVVEAQIVSNRSRP
jgi:predicted nuclease of restriction endonuclease-like (RecB) superfamily